MIINKNSFIKMQFSTLWQVVNIDVPIMPWKSWDHLLVKIHTCSVHEGLVENSQLVTNKKCTQRGFGER